MLLASDPETSDVRRLLRRDHIAVHSFVHKNLRQRQFQGVLKGLPFCRLNRTLLSMKIMKKLIWQLPLLIILGAMFAAVEIKGFTPTHEITISYGNLVDTRGGRHSVQLVLHPDGSVTWRDLTPHI